MAYTYSYSVSIGACCTGSLQTYLQKVFAPPSNVVRVCAIRQRIDIEVTDESEFKWSRRLQHMTAIRKQGYDLNDPIIPSSVQGLLSVILGVLFLGICLIAPSLSWGWMMAASFVSSVATIVVGYGSFKRAWHAFRYTRSSSMDTLFAISSTVAILVSLASCFVPGLPMMMEVGLLLFGFRHLGLALERSILKKLEDVELFTQLAPTHVEVWRQSSWLEVDVASVKPCEIIRIMPGNIIPLDGVVLKSAVKVTSKNITGQDGEYELAESSSVLAGLKLSASSMPVELKVKRDFKDSFLSKMDEVIQSSTKEKSIIETKTMYALRYFVPLVLITAVLSGGLMAYFLSISIGLGCFVAVLASACPCTLGFVAPLAHKIGVEKARRLGIIFADGRALEQAASIKHVVFDLNGTLTEGKPSVKRIDLPEHNSSAQDINYAFKIIHTIQSQLINKFDRDNVVHQGFSASRQIAAALINYIEARHDYSSAISDLLNSPPGVLEVHPGGVSYKIGSKIWRMGNSIFMINAAMNLFQCSSLDACEQEVWLSVTDESIGQSIGKSMVLARFVLHDALRADARETIQVLQQQNIAVYMCTGADKQTAMRYANMLGIAENDVFANCLPIDVDGLPQSSKAQCISQLKDKFSDACVAMVGDGGNDAAVLSQSDLGIALLHEETDKRTKNATQVHLLYGQLKPLQILFELAKNTERWIKHSLMISVMYNLITVLIASGALWFVGIILNPGVGALLMVVQLGALLAGAYKMHVQTVTYPKPNEDIKHMQTELDGQELVLQTSQTYASHDFYYDSIFRTGKDCAIKQNQLDAVASQVHKSA